MAGTTVRSLHNTGPNCSRDFAQPMCVQCASLTWWPLGGAAAAATAAAAAAAAASAAAVTAAEDGRKSRQVSCAERTASRLIKSR